MLGPELNKTHVDKIPHVETVLREVRSKKLIEGWNDQSIKDESKLRISAVEDPLTTNSDELIIDVSMSLDEVEELFLNFVLLKCKQNRTHAAKTLGISVRTLQRKLNKWNGK